MYSFYNDLRQFLKRPGYRKKLVGGPFLGGRIGLLSGTGIGVYAASPSGEVFTTTFQNGMAVLPAVSGGFYEVSAWILMAMGICIVLLIWYNWKRATQKILSLADLSKQIFQKNMELEQNQREIKRILRVVSHDLRNTLTGIRGLSSLILEGGELGKEHKEYEEWIRMMHTSSGQATELINEIMKTEVTRQDSKNHKKEVVNFRKFLKESLEHLKAKASEKNITLHIDIERDVLVRMNEEEMLRVLNNVVGNAIKYSWKGAVVYLKLKRTENRICLEVRDQGIGIPEAMKSQIFDLFTKAKRQGTEGEHSLGLGLYISKGIVEDHGGSIKFESREGRGTIFYLELPVVTVRETAKQTAH